MAAPSTDAPGWTSLHEAARRLLREEGTRLTGPADLAAGVHALDLALNDTRTSGVTISGWVFDAGGTNAGVPAVLRVYDPFEGNATGRPTG